MLQYLDFLLPLVEPKVDHPRLSVTHLLIQLGYPCIPCLLLLSLLYLMGRNDEEEFDGLGKAYQALWRLSLTSTDEVLI
jgi:hypothetical protein